MPRTKVHRRFQYQSLRKKIRNPLRVRCFLRCLSLSLPLVAFGMSWLQLIFFPNELSFLVISDRHDTEGSLIWLLNPADQRGKGNCLERKKWCVVVAGLLVMLCVSIASARSAAIRLLALLACILGDAPSFSINVVIVNALRAMKKSIPLVFHLITEFSLRLLLCNRSNWGKNTNADA